MEVITQTNIDAYPLLSRGKVRDIYEIDPERLLIVTTDRMSAFDVILPSPVPYKGAILNKLTLFWMDLFKDLVPNHVLEYDVNRFPKELLPWKDELEGRSVIVKKAKPLPIECIVRGYISGSGWKSYQKSGAICDQKLPDGLVESQKLETPLFTPTTKAAQGEHDEPVSFKQMTEIMDPAMAGKLRDLSLALYEAGATLAGEKGIIVADTKFEFGLIDGEIHLIDEVLTPDSSRFWPADLYEPGRTQSSFDKQYLRDWLSDSGWNYKPPVPDIPKEVVTKTEKKYQEAYDRLVN